MEIKKFYMNEDQTIANNDDEEEINVNLYVSNGNYYAYDVSQGRLVQVPRSEAIKAIRQAESRNRKIANKGKPVETDDEYKARMKRIADMKGDASVYKRMQSDAYEARRKSYEKKDREERERQLDNDKKLNPNKYMSRELLRSIDDLMYSQIEEVQNHSYRYGESPYSLDDDQASEIEMTEYEEEASKPIVNIYLDRSGSWHDEKKVEIGESIIDAFKKFEENGDIILNIKDFSTGLLPHAEDWQNASENDGYWQLTKWEPIYNNIMRTKPTNIVIVTDADMMDSHDKYKDIVVPGYVWIVFVGYGDSTMSKSLHSENEQSTFVYSFTHNGNFSWVK